MQKIHMSIDDVLRSFLFLTNHADEVNDLFECRVFGCLRSLHERYGARFTLYCMNTYGNGYRLSQVTDKFQPQFLENKEEGALS